MRRFLLSVFLLCVFAVLADAQEQDSVVTESVQDTLEQVVQDSSKKEEPAVLSEPVVLTEPVMEISQDSAKPVPASEQASGGLLDELYPVSPEEAISAGHILGGATLSLIQANTEDDAMNVIIGDVYEAEGYMFTVQAFGGYFIKDALAVGAHLGYSRTWLDID
ncbi:MAG: hypothetical protein J6X46_03155, partial [Prevotella sp.]|nr:hypothetical protein [Prevotella sp.]